MIKQLLIINIIDNWLQNYTSVSYTPMYNMSVSGRKNNNYTVILICTWLLILSHCITKHIHNVEERWPDTVYIGEFGPAHHSASETEEGGWKSGKDRKKRAACAIIHVPLQRKMQSQLHKHHASTEWQRVLYTESLCSREGAREVERE